MLLEKKWSRKDQKTRRKLRAKSQSFVKTSSRPLQRPKYICIRSFIISLQISCKRSECVHRCAILKTRARLTCMSMGLECLSETVSTIYCFNPNLRLFFVWNWVLLYVNENANRCAQYPRQYWRPCRRCVSTKFDSFKLNTALLNLPLKQSKIRLRFNIIWFRSRISHVPNIMH